VGSAGSDLASHYLPDTRGGTVTSGIGRAVAEQLSARGARVIISGEAGCL
jgi:hypothetical protein